MCNVKRVDLMNAQSTMSNSAAPLASSVLASSNSFWFHSLQLYSFYLLSSLTLTPFLCSCVQQKVSEKPTAYYYYYYYYYCCPATQAADRQIWRLQLINIVERLSNISLQGRWQPKQS